MKNVAAPLSYTPMSGFRSMRGVRGLGASNLPGTCWDTPGFKDCHAKQYAQAQAECQGGMARDVYGGDMALCVEKNADAYTWAGCVQKLCPQSTAPTAAGASTFSWRNTAPNATVKKLQNALNPYLTKLGANPITADGILGSGTCGAAYWVDGAAGTSFYTDYGLAQICKTVTMPTKAGTKTPVTTITVNPQTTVTKDEAWTGKTDLPWETFDADTVEVQKQLNVQLDASDYNPLSTAGKLNAPTCGAMRWAKNTQGLDLLSTQGKNCQGFTDPTKRLKPAVPVLVATPTPLPQPSSSGGSKTSAASMATTGLIVGALGLGTWWWGKKHGWFG